MEGLLAVLFLFIYHLNEWHPFSGKRMINHCHGENYFTFNIYLKIMLINVFKTKCLLKPQISKRQEGNIKGPG